MAVSPDTRESVSRSTRTRVSRATRSGTAVLIKEPLVDTPDRRAALANEAAILELLRGLAVPTTLGLDETVSPPALVLLDEDFHGLPHGAPWTIDDFFEVAIPLARALAAIHAQGVVHCDINPSNIVRRPASGDVMFIDFDSAVVGPQNDRVEQAVGTLDYLPPEQTGRVEHPVDERADLYSLGATFFELLIGKPPFESDDAVGLIHSHISKTPPRVRDLRPDVPDVINLMVARLLEKEPDERYPSAEVLADDLETCFGHWEQHGAIPLFELAASSQVQVRTPTELVGVDDELGELMMAGAARLLVITGPEGSGKTAMLNLARSSYGGGATLFEMTGDPAEIPGEQRAEPAPFSSLSSAFRSFTQDILTSSDDELRGWRDRLSVALGPHLVTLVDLIPELEAVVNADGSEEDEHSANSAQIDPGIGVHSRVQALELLLVDLAWDTHPVFVFDDVDTADRQSIEVLASLIESPNVTSLSILCSARQLPDQLGDLVDTHRSSAEVQVCSIELKPLDQRGLTELLEHALGEAVRPLSDLAASLQPVTGGIPGLVLDLLRQQVDSGGLWTATSGVWDWSDEAIASLPRVDSIVDLLIAQLGSFNDQTRTLLGVGACRRGLFVAEDLTHAGLSADEAEVILEVAARAGLLRRMETGSHVPGYVFVDERVRDTAERELDPERRSNVHLSLVRQVDEERLDPELAVELARRLDAVDIAFTDDSDRSLSVRIYRLAADHLSKVGQPSAARNHFDSALTFCPEEHPDRFDLAVLRSHQSVVADLATAAADVGSLLEIACDPLERAQAHKAAASLASGRGDAREALVELIAGLEELKIQIPSSDADLSVAFSQQLTDFARSLQGPSIAKLVEMDQVRDERVELALDLLAAGAPSAKRCWPALHPWIELTMFDLVCRHGVGPQAPSCLAGSAVIAMTELEDRVSALALLDVGERLLERFPSPEVSARFHYVSGVYFDHLRHPLEQAIANLGQAWQLSVQNDSAVGVHAVAHRALLLSAAGYTIEQQIAELDEVLAVVGETSGRLGGVVALRAHQMLNLALAGRRDVASTVRELDELLQSLQAEPDAGQIASAEIDLATVHHALATIEWWNGRPGNAWKRLDDARRDLPTVRGMSVESNVMLLVVLAGVGHARSLRRRRSSVACQNELLEVEARVQVALDRLSGLAELNPKVHSPYSLLAHAEWGCYLGRPLAESVASFQETLSASGTRYPHLQALTNQRHAELWAKEGQRTVAQALLRQARNDYQRWQCGLRVAQMIAAHPELGRTEQPGDELGGESSPLTANSAGIDVESVTKATRAIAAELSSAGLFSTLTEVLVEYAGAQSGALISVEDGTLFVEARIANGGEPTTERCELGAHDDVSTRAINFVRRTDELLVVANAASDARFRNDQHVRARRVRSLAVVPIVLRGELWGVLYLENNSLTNAFTAEHVELLKVIAGQAAVSMQQVRVFEELEQRVEQRTRELADQTRRIGALLDHLPQAVLTIGPDRCIEPQYSARAQSVLGTEDLAGRDLMEVVFANSSIDPDSQSRCEAAIDFSFGLDEFMARLNWPHLINRFSRSSQPGEERIFSVDWAPILDDADRVQQILVSIRDISDLEQARATAVAATRDLAIMQHVFGIGFGAAASFLDEERPRLNEISHLLEHEVFVANEKSTSALQSVFRLLHTMKGNARTVGFAELVGALHLAEEPVAKLADGEDVSKGVVLEAFEQVVGCFAAHESLVDRGTDGAGPTSATSIHDSRMQQIQGLLDEDEASARKRLVQIKEILDPSTELTLGSLFEAAARGLPSLAHELGKPLPAVAIAGPSVVVDARLAGPVKDVLVHLMRNALDHGIEEADLRTAMGKPPAGSIHLEVQTDQHESGTGFRFRFFDDGRGLALERLRAIVAEVHEIDSDEVSDEDAAEMIFRPGLSTAVKVSSISGRGVGMDAVREFLRRQGGSVSVEFRGPEVDGYRPFAVIVDFPDIDIPGQD